MAITLTTMRYFLEVAKLESFSAAAARLYTAQPNLSKTIAGLERSLGIDLFYREGRYIRLTEPGKLLYTEWSAALDRIDRSILQARQMMQNQRDTVTIGILEGIDISAEAPDHFGRLQRESPSLSFVVERGGFSNIWKKFEDKTYDSILTSELQGMPHAVPPSCHRQVLYSCECVLAINTSNPLADREALPLSMLQGENFILLSEEDSPEGYHTASEISRRAGFFPSKIQTVSSIETMILYVEMGAGISLMAENCRLTSNPNVRFIPLKDILFDTVAYWHPDTLPSSVQATFQAMLSEG